MSKSKWFVTLLFTAAYLSVFGVGLACLWRLFGFFLAAAAFGSSVIRDHPRFFPFCVLLGIMALFSLIAILYAHLRVSTKLSIHKRLVWIPMILCAPAALPLAYAISSFFEYLQKIF